MQRILLSILFLISSCEKTPEPEDCAGVAGGTAVLDDCGVCDANSSNDCDCGDFFTTYTQSLQQAFYYFNFVTINGTSIDTLDWVVAFNGSVCVGARQWNTALCNSGVCDVPVMGYDGESTAGYMEAGGIPTFKIYDVSEGSIYNAISIEHPWSNLATHIISTLEATTIYISPCQ